MISSFLLAALALPTPVQVVETGDREGPVTLVVVVSVDQLIPEQLDRLERWWAGGFRRFREDGWQLREAALEHGVTETGPGHATISTGLHPRGHGIVSNEWIAADGTTAEYCFGDASAGSVTSAGVRTDGVYRKRGRSPENLRARGLGDYIKDSDPASQVISISAKDRAAIGLSGRRADRALWWDTRGGSGFMSSTWYGDELPEWVDAWNEGWAGRLLDGPFGQGWQQRLPTEELFRFSKTEPDDRVGEGGRSRTFPHALPRLTRYEDGSVDEDDLATLARWVYESAAADEQVIELAREAVAQLGLGTDRHPDLLALGLSACDVVGHRYGPRSWEVTDTLLRADRLLGELFDELDERVGGGRWIAVLTADHGVLGLPESLVHRELPAVRVGVPDVREAFDAVREDLQERFGSDFGMRPTHRGVRFDAEQLAQAGGDPVEVRARAAERLASAGRGFLAHAFTWEALRDRAATGPGPHEVWDEGEDERILRLEAWSFDAERTPDVVFVLRRYHLTGFADGTSHGSPWAYDREVPLYFLGPGFPARGDDRPAATVDVLPTLLDRLRIDVPEELDGRVLDPGD